MKIGALMKEYMDDLESRSHTVGARLLPESMNTAAGMPIVAKENVWTVQPGPERLVRKFKFSSPQHRALFIEELLSEEEKTGHHGKITIEGLEVTIEVWTHDVNKVTELDQEYAGACDQMYDDVSLVGFRYERY